MLIRYLIRRALAAVVTLVGVSMLIFVIARVIPGDPARMALGPMASKEQIQDLREDLHLNDSLPVQYWEYVNSPLKKALLTGFHSTAKHNATKAVSPSSETMRTI